MKLLDIGCGTAHIIESLAVNHERVIFIGLDVSSAMLKIAKLNTARLPNVILVKGDGLKLPFSDCSFDVVITRLAEYSPQEVHRVLKKGGFFFEYDLGQRLTRKFWNSFKEELKRKVSSFLTILGVEKGKCTKKLWLAAFQWKVLTTIKR
jgi:ubiquinone/menaquinone biosynthesis C-methylase UbiE